MVFLFISFTEAARGWRRVWIVYELSCPWLSAEHILYEVRNDSWRPMLHEWKIFHQFSTLKKELWHQKSRQMIEAAWNASASKMEECPHICWPFAPSSTRNFKSDRRRHPQWSLSSNKLKNRDWKPFLTFLGVFWWDFEIAIRISWMGRGAARSNIRKMLKLV